MQTATAEGVGGFDFYFREEVKFLTHEETRESGFLTKNEYSALGPNGIRKDKTCQHTPGQGGYLYFRGLRSRLCSGRRGSRE